LWVGADVGCEDGLDDVGADEVGTDVDVELAWLAEWSWEEYDCALELPLLLFAPALDP
jgi:hypothetical protein